ncbi:IPT/TIG domain-containing protein [Amycolatopsis sp. NBC_01307]|uniref:RHS repeat-associated core domain-containing protein n=1 Tax=Amycolatopsis sp. NBC_01307 TaxID=2903561 RepID=UPI002E14D151|nr:IPT/TIG domain-containing protein [Amycolatopsis sp. NBC_01307]
MARSSRFAAFAAALLIAGQIAGFTHPAGAEPAAATAKAAALPSTPTNYAYDAAGRVKGVSQSTGSGAAARYNYDDSGNVTSIDRTVASALSVSSFVPAQAAAGAKVTVAGTGFAATAGANTVKFGGKAATVTTASATSLEVTVPTGAVTGPVTVTTTAGTATSQQSFTVDAATAAPAVTGFSPATGVAGTTVTLTGTGFAPVAADDTVTFGLTRARVTAATATSLTVTVPDAATSGRITVATPGGTAAVSGTDFVVVPRGYAVADVGSAATLAADGTAATVSVAASGKVALLRFAGTKGQRLSLGLTGSTITTEYSVAVFTPYGAPFARNDYDAPRLSTYLYGGYELPPLPSSGVYQVVVDPSAAGTGSVTATLSSRVTGTLDPAGAGVTVALARAGQQAELTLPVTAGQHIGVGFSGSTFAASTQLTLSVKEPNGTPLLWNAQGSTRGLLKSDGGGDYDFVPSQTGTYTLVVGSTDATTGSLTVTASPALEAGAITLGAPKNLAISRPGQDARLTYAGVAGQQLSLDFDQYTFGYFPYLTVTKPDGSALYAGPSGYHADFPALPVDGGYLITVSPQSTTGSATLLLTTRQDAGTLTTTGPAVTVNLPQSGQTASLAFTATAGSGLSLAFTNWTLPGTVLAQVIKPTGEVEAAYDVGSLSTFWFVPGASGAYRLLLTPDGSGAGSAAVTLSAETAGGTIAVGTPKTVSATRPGQTTRLSFTGTANQRLSLAFPSYGFTYYLGVMVIRPDGGLLRNGTITATQVDLGPLPAAGTYQIVVYPFAETGTAQLTLAERTDAGTATVGGAAKTMTVAQAGKYVETSFTATANQRLSIGFTNWTFPAAGYFRARVVDANGVESEDILVYKSGAVDTKVGAAGTYRLILAPGANATGSVSATLSQQLDGGAIAFNTAKTVTMSRAGQSVRLTYAGTAGQNLSLNSTSTTLPYYPYVEVRKPDGTVLTQHAGAASVPIATLPVTGTYEIVVSPYSYTGSDTLKLVTRAALQPLVTQPSAPRATAAPPLPGVPRALAEGGKPANRPRAERPDTGTQTSPAAGASWVPDARNLSGADWTTHLPPVTGDETPALQGKPGSTAVSGRVRTLDGHPLAGVTLSVGAARGVSDAQGRFLLEGVTPGHGVLRIDGASASTPDRRFGLYDDGVDLVAGRTTVLPYPIWMTALDTKHMVRFASPAPAEVVVTTPAIPGLEVRLPKGAVVRDSAGKVVTELGITAIPVDRPPFPLPKSNVPTYFTVQPGSSYVFPTGARVIYPNYPHAPPGATMDFWHYDPAGRGWFVYGHGKVTPDGKQVVPDPGTEVYQFTGAMLIEPGVDAPPDAAPAPGGDTVGGDPVDLGSGLLSDTHTDLTVSDTLPIGVTRTYQQADTGRRTFGVGTGSDYDVYLYAQQQWIDGQLILPDGAKVKYHRITPGGTGPTDYLTAAFAADPTPTKYAGSVLAWNGNGFDLRLRDGTTLVFGEEAPLQAIRDRFGNTVTITRGPAQADTDGHVRAKGPITQVTSPNGRWISFAHDTANRITRAEDNTGRAVGYTYDASGRLSTFTDATGAVTTYTYDGQGRLATAKDPRGTVYLANLYDTNGRVSKQTVAGGGTYQFAYLTDSAGKVTETKLTDPRGTVRRVTFNAAGYSTSDTAAFGDALARTTTIARDPATNLVTSTTDPLGRRTDLTYDAFGDVTGTTELAGTAAARTRTYAYAGPFGQLSQATDPLGRVTTFGYGANGAPRTTTDPLTRVTTVDTDEQGRVTKVTDPLSHATSYGYLLGDPVTVTDALGRVARRVTDGTGRPVAQIDRAGAVTRATYDADDRVRSITDPLGRVTAYEYDANGNPVKLTDPRGGVTAYTYDAANRATTETDPLNRVTTTSYDTEGNRTGLTTARGKASDYAFDSLGRLTQARFGVSGSTAESQIAYAYDAGDRATSITDSAGGTTTFTVDGFDRITRAVSPQGQLDYTFDAADQRTGLTVAGQPQITYGYDADGQLTQVQRGSDTVALGYDAAGRRSAVTLPDGIAQNYTYDADDRITAIGYAKAGAALGDLSYAYDPAGRLTQAGGSYARGDVPAAYGPAVYDAANQLTSLAGVARTYDADGNPTSDGTTSYVWDARGQLASSARAGVSTTYAYDGLGRRTGKTTAGVTTGYLFDGLNVVQELTGGTPSANLLTGGVDEVFARTSGGTTRSLLTDRLGSTIAVADGAGTVTGEYTYQPFGATTLTGDDGGNPTRFTGRDDEGNGLYQYRSRYYSTTDQRFLGQDSLGFGGGDTNLYAYVGDAPTTFVDPLGTSAKPAIPEKPRRIALGDGTFQYPDGSIRDHAGHFVGTTGARPGSQAEADVWDRLEELGYEVIREPVTVTGNDGQTRIFDGAIVRPDDGRLIGIEVKSGTARLTPEQRAFDTWLNTTPGAEAVGVGRHAGRQVVGVYQWNVP